MGNGGWVAVEHLPCPPKLSQDSSLHHPYGNFFQAHLYYHVNLKNLANAPAHPLACVVSCDVEGNKYKSALLFVVLCYSCRVANSISSCIAHWRPPPGCLKVIWVVLKCCSPAYAQKPDQAAVVLAVMRLGPDLVLEKTSLMRIESMNEFLT